MNAKQWPCASADQSSHPCSTRVPVEFVFLTRPDVETPSIVHEDRLSGLVHATALRMLARATLLLAAHLTGCPPCDLAPFFSLVFLHRFSAPLAVGTAAGLS